MLYSGGHEIYVSFGPWFNMVGLFVHGWAGTSYSGLTHVSPITISVIPSPPMQDAAVIPKESVAWLPVL